jgi:hypothetical protein
MTVRLGEALHDQKVAVLQRAPKSPKLFLIMTETIGRRNFFIDRWNILTAVRSITGAMYCKACIQRNQSKPQNYHRSIRQNCKYPSIQRNQSNVFCLAVRFLELLDK